MLTKNDAFLKIMKITILTFLLLSKM